MTGFDNLISVNNNTVVAFTGINKFPCDCNC